MGLWPIQGDEKRLGPETTLYGTTALSLSSRAKPRDLRFRGPFLEKRTCPRNELSSRLPRRAVGPERTRISCHAALDKATCAAFIKESRIKFASATNFYRKSGVAEWRDLRFPP